MARNAPKYSTKQHRQHTHEATRRHAWLWRTRRDSSPALQNAEDSLRSATADSGSVDGASPAARATFSRELYGRVLDDAPALEQVHADAPKWQPALQRAMDDAVARLQPSLGGDADFAAMATKGLLERAAEQLPSLMGRLEQEEAERQERQANGEPEPERAPGDPMTAGEILAAGMRRKADALAGEVADTKVALNGLAPGLGNPPSRKDEGDPRRLALVDALRNDDRLRKVLRLAGRLQRVHAKVRQMRTSDGCEEIVDVEQGGDLQRLLAGNLALLDDEDLGDWALAQVIERKALQYALAGREPLGRGPITVLRDVSGSMGRSNGQPHAWAAAVCILACQVGAKEARAVTVANYTRNVQAARVLPVGATRTQLADMVMEIATDGCGGGTQMDPVLEWAMQGVQHTRADLIMVTDGRAESVSPDLLQRLDAAKQEHGLKVAALTINSGTLYPGLRQVCDTITDLDRGDTAKQAAKGLAL